MYKEAQHNTTNEIDKTTTTPSAPRQRNRQGKRNNSNSKHTKIHNNKMPATTAANATAKQNYQPKDDTEAHHNKGNR